MPAERERFHALIAPRVDRLIEIGIEVAAAVAKQAGKTPSAHFAFDSGALREVCGAVSVDDEVPGWDGTWGSLLRHWGSLAASARDALRPFYTKLTPELLEALREEELAMDAVLRTERLARAFKAPDMSRLDAPLFDWLTSVDMLVSERKESIAPQMPLPEHSALDAATIKVPMDDFIRQHKDFKNSLKFGAE